MKKLVFCGIISLFIGGIANASTSEFSTYESTFLQTINQNTENEIIGEGVDEGGYFIIVSTDTLCVKVYPSRSGSGMVDH